MLYKHKFQIFRPESNHEQRKNQNTPEKHTINSASRRGTHAHQTHRKNTKVVPGSRSNLDSKHLSSNKKYSLKQQAQQNRGKAKIKVTKKDTGRTGRETQTRHAYLQNQHLEYHEKTTLLVATYSTTIQQQRA